MSCNSCIKGNYDFIVKEIDSSAFLYQDISTWQTGNNYCTPESYRVAIYFPHNSDPVYTNFSTDSFNKVTPQSLGIENPYPKFTDGVYYFSIEEGSEGYCGVAFRRSVAIIPALQCCFDKAFLKYALFRKDEIKHIEFLIRSVRLNALVGNIQMSEDYYEQAKSALKKLDCDCSF